MLCVCVINQAQGNKGIDYVFPQRYNRQSTGSRPAKSAKLRNACNLSGLLVHRVVRYVYRPPPLLILRISLMNVPLEKVVPLITT